jgi:hypothetical protein
MRACTFIQIHVKKRHQQQKTKQKSNKKTNKQTNKQTKTHTHTKALKMHKGASMSLDLFSFSFYC